MQATYIIVREDLQLDPATIVTEGLIIGRLPTCELLLNHPSVSRLHAGITFNDADDYVIRNLRPSNPIIINGHKLEDYAALAPGDIVGVGPFGLNIDFQESTIVITVSLQIAATAADAIRRREASGLWTLETTNQLDFPRESTHAKPSSHKHKSPLESSQALDVFWEKRITAATKAVRPSALFPRTGRPIGKAQSLWTPTTDLKRRWPASMLLWGALPIALISITAAVFYASAFAPAAISDAHARSTMNLSPPIADRASSSSCTACHSLAGEMQTKCSSCHTTDAFIATVVKPHAEAGIGCTACHAEHRGAHFSAIDGALLSCFQCHDNQNTQTYNGKKVSTPHGGTFGYPVIDGHWKWTGLDQDEFELRKSSLRLERLSTDSEDQWRSKQFHAVHLYRVRAVPGLGANKEGELSCSSCHATRDPIDLVTPRTTCARCHNGQLDARAGRQVVAADKPNCTSCHVQHMKDRRHWNPGLLTGN